MEAPYALALAAGLVAALNPCGFAMLPAYLALLVGDGPSADAGRSNRAAAVRRALTMTAAMTAGFVAVFGGFALLVVPLALSIQEYLPWVTVVVGVLLVAIGLWLASGRELALGAPRSLGGAPSTSVRSMVGYGVAYAVASLSCTVGPFLAIMSTTFTSVGAVQGVAVFVVYALGMGLVVGVLALAVALARGALVAKVRRALPYVTRASGVLLVLAGAYVTYFGVYELRLFAGRTSGADPVIDAALEVQGVAVRWVQQLGPWWIVAVFAVLAAGGLFLGRRRRALTR